MSDSEDEVFFRDAEARNDQDVVKQPDGAVGGQNVDHENASGDLTSHDKRMERDLMTLLLRMQRSQNPVKTFPRFDGSESWESYFQQILRVRNINGWSDEEAADCLSLSLQGPALELLNVVEKAQGGKRLGWTGLVQMLRSSFSSVEDTFTLRSSLRDRKQLRSETVPQFHMAIRKNVAKAYPSKSLREQDEIGVEVFTQAILDDEVRLALLRAQPKTMDEALRCAEKERILLEGARRQPQASLNFPHSDYTGGSAPEDHCYGVSTFNQSKDRGLGRGGSRPPRSRSQEMRDIRQEMARLAARFDELEDDNHKNSSSPQNQSGKGRGANHRFQRGRCWGCGGTGHYRKQCPSN